MSDIKEIPTWEGTLYLASVIDCFSRRVVGWSMREDMQAELVVEALEMAVSRRQPAGELVHHFRSGLAVRLARLRPALPTGRDRPVDGLEGRLLRRRRLRELSRLAREGPAPPALLPHPPTSANGGVRLHRGVLHRQRLHSTPGYRSPEEYEQDYERGDCKREEETIFIEEERKAA